MENKAFDKGVSAEAINPQLDQSDNPNSNTKRESSRSVKSLNMESIRTKVDLSKQPIRQGDKKSESNQEDIESELDELMYKNDPKRTCCYSQCMGKPFRPFLYGTELLDVRNFDAFVKPGDHLAPWRGNFPFYSHHAIVTRPIGAKDKASYGIEDIVTSLTPHLTQKYIVRKLKQVNNYEDDTHVHALTQAVETIVKAATPPYTIQKEDFTRREIRRLWDEDESPTFSHEEEGRGIKGMRMAEANVKNYLKIEWDLKDNETETAKRIFDMITKGKENETYLNADGIGALWKIVKVGLNNELAIAVFKELLKSKHEEDSSEEDITNLVENVLQPTCCDYNFYNGYIKFWEIRILSEYIKVGTDSKLTMGKDDFLRFLRVANKNPFTAHKYIQTVIERKSKYGDSKTGSEFKVEALKFLWQNFRRKIKKVGMSKNQTIRFVVNMFEKMENMHVIELIEKLPLNGSGRYDPLDVIVLFGSMRRKKIEGRYSEAIQLPEANVKRYLERELGKGIFKRKDRAWKTDENDLESVWKKHCAIENTEVLVANDIDNLLTFVRKMEPGVIHRQAHGVVRSKLDFNHRRDVLFKVTYPVQLSLSTIEDRIGAIDKEKSMTAPYSLTTLNCETTSLRATMDPKNVMHEYCCIPGSSQVQEVNVGVLSRLTKAFVVILFRIIFPLIAIYINEIANGIPFPLDWVGYVLTIAFEVCYVTLTITGCGCWWCCKCTTDDDNLCTLHTKNRDRFLLFWRTFVQEFFLLSFGIGLSYVIEHPLCLDYFNGSQNTCIIVEGFGYLGGALLGFVFGRWLVFCCTLGCPLECGKDGQCCRGCVIDLCGCRRCASNCISFCRRCRNDGP